MNENITGKVVVITGASSGLGEATARLLAKSGAIVVLGARRSDRIEALAAELKKAGGQALAVATDVVHRDQVKRLVDTAVKSFGRIDVMLNNAGIMPLAPLEQLKVDEWDQMIDVNLKEIQEQTKAFVGKIAVPAATFARMVAFAINEPADVDVNEILFRPTAQPI